MNYKFNVFLTGLLMTNSISAATLIDLGLKPITYLQRYSAISKSLTTNQTKLEQVRMDVDFNQTTHTRLQQTYAGYPIWDATAIVHTPKTNLKNSFDMPISMNSNSTMNGIIYEGLEKDLANTPNYELSDAQKTRALQEAKFSYQKKSNLTAINFQQEAIKTIVYIDENNQAHYAYLISFFVDDKMTGPHRPTSIVDAGSLRAYRSWDQVKTVESEHKWVLGGGIGGNEKIGELIYDGNTGHLPAMTMWHIYYEEITDKGEKRVLSNCYLHNDDIIVKDVAFENYEVSNKCYSIESKHNNVYWLDWDKQQTRWKNDEVNGGYSPSLDVLYGASIVKKLYQEWYGIPVLTQKDGKTPARLTLKVHFGRNIDDAFADDDEMTFGDGGKRFYPLTSLDVVAHEISHAFTSQHSNIDSSILQMAALHESFSDIAAIAAQFYVNGKINTWDIGRSITKGEGALRYLDNPLKDGLSIDHMKDLDYMNPHLIAGIFNKAFYLIATSSNWNVQKAFNVMVKANMNYWTSSMKTFDEAACGVISATKDYKYNVADVIVAFTKVGINTSRCT